MRLWHALAVLAGVASLFAIVLPLAAQTPTPGPAASPAASSGPGLTFPTLTPVPSATPNPRLAYAPFFLAAGLQSSDLPAGDIIFLQTPAGSADLQQAFSDAGVVPVAGFLQVGGSFVNASLADILTGVAPLNAGLFVGAAPADAATVLAAVRDDAGSYIGSADQVSDVTVLTGPALGDESVEAHATLTLTDDSSGDTTNLDVVLLAVRRGRVFSLTELTGADSQQAAAEAVARALDARVKAALPLLPAQ